MGDVLLAVRSGCRKWGGGTPQSSLICTAMARAIKRFIMPTAATADSWFGLRRRSEDASGVLPDQKWKGPRGLPSCQKDRQTCLAVTRRPNTAAAAGLIMPRAHNHTESIDRSREEEKRRREAWMAGGREGTGSMQARSAVPLWARRGPPCSLPLPIHHLYPCIRPHRTLKGEGGIRAREVGALGQLRGTGLQMSS